MREQATKIKQATRYAKASRGGVDETPPTWDDVESWGGHAHPFPVTARQGRFETTRPPDLRLSFC